MNCPSKISNPLFYCDCSRVLNGSLLLAAVVWLNGTAMPSNADPVYGVIHTSTGNNLYSFNSDGSGFTNHGLLTVGSVNVLTDGIAASTAHGLLGYQLESNGSTLMSIDVPSATGTLRGTVLTGKTISGATFDLQDRLWAVDIAASELLQIDPVSGQIIGAGVTLTIPRS